MSAEMSVGDGYRKNPVEEDSDSGDNSVCSDISSDSSDNSVCGDISDDSESSDDSVCGESSDDGEGGDDGESVDDGEVCEDIANDIVVDVAVDTAEEVIDAIIDAAEGVVDDTASVATPVSSGSYQTNFSLLSRPSSGHDGRIAYDSAIRAIGSPIQHMHPFGQPFGQPFYGQPIHGQPMYGAYPMYYPHPVMFAVPPPHSPVSFFSGPSSPASFGGSPITQCATPLTQSSDNAAWHTPASHAVSHNRPPLSRPQRRTTTANIMRGGHQSGYHRGAQGSRSDNMVSIDDDRQVQHAATFATIPEDTTMSEPQRSASVDPHHMFIDSSADSAATDSAITMSTASASAEEVEVPRSSDTIVMLPYTLVARGANFQNYIEEQHECTVCGMFTNKIAKVVSCRDSAAGAKLIDAKHRWVCDGCFINAGIPASTAEHYALHVVNVDKDWYDNVGVYANGSVDVFYEMPVNKRGDNSHTTVFRLKKSGPVWTVLSVEKNAYVDGPFD